MGAGRIEGHKDLGGFAPNTPTRAFSPCPIFAALSCGSTRESRDNVPCRVWGSAPRFYQPSVLLSFRILARSCSRKTQFCTRGSRDNVPCRVWGGASRFYQPTVLLSFRLLARSCSRKTQFCIRGSRDNVPCGVWGRPHGFRFSSLAGCGAAPHGFTIFQARGTVPACGPP